MNAESSRALDQSSTYTVYEISGDLPITVGEKIMPYRDDAPAVQVLIKKSVPREQALAILERVFQKLANRDNGAAKEEGE
jgi:hypothetical protein